MSMRKWIFIQKSYNDMRVDEVKGRLNFSLFIIIGKRKINERE